MPVIWFAGGNAGFGEDCWQLGSALGYQCTFFPDLVAAEKQLLSGECPAALFVYLDRNVHQDLKILDSIRKRAVWQSLAILVVLAEPMPEISIQIRGLGVDGVLLVPLMVESVAPELQKALQRRKIFSCN